MYINIGQVTDYEQEDTIKFSVNDYHVKVWNNDLNVLFIRTPDMNEWLDEEHTKWIDAIEELEGLIKDLS